MNPDGSSAGDDTHEDGAQGEEADQGYGGKNPMDGAVAGRRLDVEASEVGKAIGAEASTAVGKGPKAIGTAKPVARPEAVADRVILDTRGDSSGAVLSVLARCSRDSLYFRRARGPLGEAGRSMRTYAAVRSTIHPASP